MRLSKLVLFFVAALCCVVAVGAWSTSQAQAQERKFVAQGGAPVPYTGFLALYVGQQAGFTAWRGYDLDADGEALLGESCGD